MRPEPAVQALFGQYPYATLVEDIRDFAVFLLDLEGRIVSWNAGARLIFGYEKAEMVGQSGALLFVPEDRENQVPEEEMEAARREGRAEAARWHQRKDGSRFWGEGVLRPMHHEAGELRGYAKLLRDDTPRKLIEDDLRVSQERFELVARATSDAVWDWNLVSHQVWWNNNVETIFGYPPAAVAGTAAWWKEQLHPGDRDRVLSSIEGCITQNRQKWECEYRFRCADGSFAAVLDRGYVLRDAAGRALRMLGSMTDVSQRKTLEAERQIFERLAHNNPDFIGIFDLEGRVNYVNPAALQLVGLADLEAAQKTILLDYSFAEDRDRMKNEFLPRVLREGSGATEMRFRHFQSAAARWMMCQVFVLRDAQGQPIALAMMSRDISAERQSLSEREELLQKLEFERGRLAGIFQTSPAFVAVLRGPQHVFEMANPNYYQLVGHRDILGKPLLEALPEIEGQGFVELLDGVLHTGVPFEGHGIAAQLQREPNGPLEERFVDLLYQPLFEADGTISGIFAHGVDVTELVRARRVAEETNRVKDEFLATLSHELRTPLTAILGWANILQSEGLTPEEIKRGVATIERNARSQGQLIEDILDVSRVVTGKLRLEVQPVDLAGIIEEAVATVTPAAAAKGIRLQRVLDASTSVVSGDPARLQQIVWNLMSNAIKFTPRDGRVQIRLERINSHVEIIISDSGAGIAPEVLPHVFERFRQADSSSTRTHGGLGLGLAIVRHLVELHGGSVEAHSEGLGQGATFTVKLPLVAVRSLDGRGGEEERRVHPTRGESAPGTWPRLDGLHVLVVDDQEDTRVFLQVVLERCGARVTTVASAPAAFAALQEMRPDVLLSDLGMPDEDGYSLIKRVRALPKDAGGQTPAAALTAFARVEDRVKVLRAGFQIHLPKPVEPLELASVIANLAGRHDDD